jgi:hypothetical protein
MLPITVIIVAATTFILGLIGIFTHLIRRNEMGGMGINEQGFV